MHVQCLFVLCVYKWCVAVRGGHPLCIFHDCFSAFSLSRRDSQQTWSLFVWLGWLSSKPLGTSSLPSAEIRAIGRFTWLLESESRWPCLCGKHFVSHQPPSFPLSHFLGGKTNPPCDMTVILFRAQQVLFHYLHKIRPNNILPWRKDQSFMSRPIRPTPPSGLRSD